MPSYLALCLTTGACLWLVGLILRRSPSGFSWYPWISLVVFLAGFFWLSTTASAELWAFAPRAAGFLSLGIFLIPNQRWALVFLPLLFFSFDAAAFVLPAFAGLLIQPPGWSYLVLRAYDAARGLHRRRNPPGDVEADQRPPDARRGVLSRFVLQTTAFPALLTGPVILDGSYSLRKSPYSLRLPGDRRAAALLTLGIIKVLVILPWWNAHFETGVLKPFQWNLEALRSFFGAGVYGYGRILLDFSGAADIAVGLAGLTGMRIRHNFRRPLAASSVSDFWRRWHITLGAFVRRHIYIPMGGSRRGAPRTIMNLVFAMTVIGLWHGLRWNFLIWGLLHAGAMVFERFVLPVAPSGFGWTIARICCTQIFVASTWAVFFW